MNAAANENSSFRVVVAGAGIGGLFMAEKLKHARIAFTVYEKADEVGGTWRENNYPGLFVETPANTKLSSCRVQLT